MLTLTLFDVVKGPMGEDKCRIEYSKELGYFKNTFYGYHTKAEVVKELSRALDLIEAHPGVFSKSLGDITLVEGPWDEANEWIASEYLPRAMKAGMTMNANVIGSDLFSNLSMDNLVQNVGGMLQIGTFESEEDAHAWLGI